jgi:hypothetical protein
LGTPDCVGMLTLTSVTMDSNSVQIGVCHLVRIHNEAARGKPRRVLLPRYFNVVARARCWVDEDQLVLEFRNLGIGPTRTVRFGAPEQIDPRTRFDSLSGKWSMKFNVGRDQWCLDIRQSDLCIFEQLSWFHNFPIPRLF